MRRVAENGCTAVSCSLVTRQASAPRAAASDRSPARAAAAPKAGKLCPQPHGFGRETRLRSGWGRTAGSPAGPRAGGVLEARRGRLAEDPWSTNVESEAVSYQKPPEENGASGTVGGKAAAGQGAPPGRRAAPAGAIYGAITAGAAARTPPGPTDLLTGARLPHRPPAAAAACNAHLGGARHEYAMRQHAPAGDKSGRMAPAGQIAAADDYGRLPPPSAAPDHPPPPHHC
ncbi:potassium/sodium hyperpolarization-activated cyclic nucleotide-gated channel 4-like [Schistocerca serialis cubense]|uniref:potassium/sodium hyperpolarization-activated cyclic nucleotide-gated channel 4-like n=1 Tax=Schistocerca serialis cubense TaxID=2023355 RepID=UPI00214F0BC5|nr:potassium/sodium hyperpolarization-activated cyclic nucleotide-gated channel 4-like [Schistocerca serialis cubense]